jgi:hypothetical protein
MCACIAKDIYFPLSLLMFKHCFSDVLSVYAVSCAPSPAITSDIFQEHEVKLKLIIVVAQGASSLEDHQPATIGSNGKFADFSSIVIRMVFQELGMDFNFDAW